MAGHGGSQRRGLAEWCTVKQVVAWGARRGKTKKIFFFVAADLRGGCYFHVKIKWVPTNLVFSQLKEYPISLNCYKDIYP